VNHKIAAFALLILGTAALAVGAAMHRVRPAAIVVALVLFLGCGTLLSKAGGLARGLASWVNKRVHVEVWGSALPGQGESVFEVHAVRALGAGLHIYLRHGNEPPRDLKVAQPRLATLGESQVIIREAAYVQWAGKRIPRGNNVTAVSMQTVE